MNIIHILLRVCVLNCQYGVPLGLEEVLDSYTINRHNLRKYYFVADSKSLQLGTNLPDTNRNKPYRNILIFDAWGCSKDPIF